MGIQEEIQENCKHKLKIIYKKEGPNPKDSICHTDLIVAICTRCDKIFQWRPMESEVDQYLDLWQNEEEVELLMKKMIQEKGDDEFLLSDSDDDEK